MPTTSENSAKVNCPSMQTSSPPASPQPALRTKPVRRERRDRRSPRGATSPTVSSRQRRSMSGPGSGERWRSAHNSLKPTVTTTIMWTSHSPASRLPVQSRWKEWQQDLCNTPPSSQNATASPRASALNTLPTNTFRTKRKWRVSHRPTTISSPRCLSPLPSEKEKTPCNSWRHTPSKP